MKSSIHLKKNNSYLLGERMANPFVEFGFIILTVLGVSVIMRILRQPLIMAYILSGVLVGPLVLDLIQETETLHLFSELGIAFLLFIVGLHLSPRVIKEVGKVSLVTGLGQILFTVAIGFGIGVLLGFSYLTAMYIAIAVAFSSTIIIMKLLSDKDALEKLYGKISIGFLLVQDLVAIMLLIILSSLEGGSSFGTILATTFLKGAVLAAVLIPFSMYVLPRCEKFFAKSQEFLFLFAISWGFALSILFQQIGFSIEVGALIAGIILSISPYSYEISSRLKPLRDFFIIFFFIILGSQMAFGAIRELFLPAIIFSVFILIGNPIIIMVLMGLLGYSKKIGFMAGLTVAQVSEFSLIIIAWGVKVGSLTPEIRSMLTLIALITIAGSTYMIVYSEQIFNRLSPLLSIFERRKVKEKELPKKGYDYILLGQNGIGFSIIKAFKKITKNFVVVDYNPDIVQDLRREGINAVYGDADDPEFLEDLLVHKASVIVSTIPDRETNHLILNALKKYQERPVLILTAREIPVAFELYKGGADYVIMPHFLGGEYTANIIEKAKTNKKRYEKEKEKELLILADRLKRGHQHPPRNPRKQKSI